MFYLSPWTGRTLQSFFVDGATHIDCSKGNELYGIEDINLDGEGNNAFCLDYSAYRGAYEFYSTLQSYTGCYWLGLINSVQMNGNENGTGSALGLLYSSGGIVNMIQQLLEVLEGLG